MTEKRSRLVARGGPWSGEACEIQTGALEDQASGNLPTLRLATISADNLCQTSNMIYANFTVFRDRSDRGALLHGFLLTLTAGDRNGSF